MPHEQSGKCRDNVHLDYLKRYYIAYNLFVFSQGLVAVFLNVLFFSAGSYTELLYFQLISTIGIFLSFTACSYALRRYSPSSLFAYGEIFRAALLMAIVVGMQFTSNVYLLGLLYGISGGIFWTGNNALMYDISRKRNRMSFISMNNIIGGIAAFVAPVFAGLAIQFTPLVGPFKFSGDFAFAVLFLVLSSLYMARSRIRTPRLKGFKIRNTAIRGVEGYGSFKVYFLLSQFFALPFITIIPVYVFYTTGSYLVAGVFASFTIMTGIIANYLSKKITNWEGFIRIAVAGIILSPFALLSYKYTGAAASVFVFSFAYTLFSVPLANKAYSNFMSLIDRYKNTDRAYFMVNREYYLAAGRCAVVGILIALSYYVGVTAAIEVFMPLASLYAVTYIYTAGNGKPAVPLVFRSIFSRS